jgi:hypothetical protein
MMNGIRKRKPRVKMPKVATKLRPPKMKGPKMGRGGHKLAFGMKKPRKKKAV